MSAPVTRAAGAFTDGLHVSLGGTATELDVLQIGRGDTLFTQGDPEDRLYLITEGKVKIGCRAPDGRDHLLAIVGPCEVLGEESVFDPGPCPMTATAITEVRVVSLAGDTVRACIAARPEVAEGLMQTMARRLRRANDHIADLALADVPGRVATQLLALGHQFGVPDQDGALHLRHDLTQAEIGQLVGAVRETVNKAMSDFVRRGWIRLEGRSVVIIDADRLRNRTRTGPGVAAPASNPDQHSPTTPPSPPPTQPPSAAGTTPRTTTTRQARTHQHRPRRITTTTRVDPVPSRE